MATKKRSRKKSFEPMSIAVRGFKSIRKEQTLDIKPLTILAGANSSGKSSIMQPLLLMKQTLEAQYDPGVFLLDGPNVKFTSYDQFLNTSTGKSRTRSFDITISTKFRDSKFIYEFKKNDDPVIKSISGNIHVSNIEFELTETSISDEYLDKVINAFKQTEKQDIEVIKDRCLLKVGEWSNEWNITYLDFRSEKELISRTIHLAGLRGNPERTYKISGISNIFPGTFEKYTANILFDWQKRKNTNEYIELCSQLNELGLTWKVVPVKFDDSRIEIKVGRLPDIIDENEDDLVSIADVGFGVSQTLPVLIALLVAEKDQIVYIEQPEIHLHPNAQYKLAQFFVEAANRGVRVVVETHSSIFIRGVQTHIAKGDIDPERVGLNWFNRSPKTGATTITTAELGDDGSYGDWPEDFDDTYLSADREYLDAAALKDFE